MSIQSTETVSTTGNAVTFTVPNPTPAVPAPTDPDRVFTKEDIERARQQEKDKVYGRVDELQQRLSVFEQEREERLRNEEDARKAADEAERLRREAEESLADKIARQTAEFEARLEAERAEREALAAALQKEREFAALEQHRAQTLAAHSDEILPELVDLVKGNTPEEIDRSIAGLVERSRSILENAGAALQTQRQQTPGPRVTAPPVGPLEIESGQKTLSAADIAAMSMDEYAKYRGSLGVTGGSSHRGLFDR